MREIKFRGKSLKTDRWVYGYYVHLEDIMRGRETHRIYSGLADSMPDGEGYDFSADYEDVDPDTIGQYTCLKDANWKEIYEGDILKTAFSNYVFGTVMYHSNGYFYILEFSMDLNESDHRPLGEMLKLDIDGIPCNFSIVGNIYDNQELMKNESKLSRAQV